MFLTKIDLNKCRYYWQVTILGIKIVKLFKYCVGNVINS